MVGCSMCVVGVSLPLLWVCLDNMSLLDQNTQPHLQCLRASPSHGLFRLKQKSHVLLSITHRARARANRSNFQPQLLQTGRCYVLVLALAAAGEQSTDEPASLQVFSRHGGSFFFWLPAWKIDSHMYGREISTAVEYVEGQFV